MGWTEISLIKTDTQLLARSLTCLKLRFVFTDRTGNARSPPYHQADHLKNSKTLSNFLLNNFKFLAVRTLNKLSKSIITSQRNRQSREDFPSDITQRHQQPEVSIDHAETPENLSNSAWTDKQVTTIFMSH